MNTIATHYEILGVPADASSDRIRAAYRDRARRYHPDRNARADGRADAMAAVNEAYRVLSDPDRRLGYDRTLGGPSARSAPFPASPAGADEVAPPPPPALS
ncbi:MAG: DnaJ domain-containing protein, partial [Ilumatobacter sp.]|nr:DnaJ domain-containing protein [Ilumatobacter sp.]